MKKSGVISLSIIIFLIALSGVLFGVVFCLRDQKVIILDKSELEISNEDIIKTAGLKKGQSIFMIDKDKAISKIEAKYPYLKVVQIKTTSVTEIEICLRARHDMFYAKHNNNFYILDEELKVLTIIENNESNEPTQLTRIEETALNINDLTKVCDFVGNEKQQKAVKELYVALITTVAKTEGEGEEAIEVAITREDVCDILKNIQFEVFETYNKMVITTKYGVKLDIENPTQNMQDKINICFATIEHFLSDPQTESKAQTGTIKIFYDIENNQKCVYIPHAD